MRAWILLLCLCCLASRPAQAQVWHFVAELRPDRAELDVRACSSAGSAALRFVAGRDAGVFLRHAQRSRGGDLQRSRGGLRALDWQPGECLLTRIDLDRAAAADRYRLGRGEGFWRLDPRDWLWRPARLDADSVVEFRLPPGWSVSAPWRPRAQGGYRIGATPADWPGRVAFGRFTEQRIERSGGVLRLAVLQPADAAVADAVHGWIGAVADDLLQAYGRLPLADVQVLVLPLPGVRSAVPWGQVTRGGGSAVHLFPGLAAGPAAWRADWTATHEFAHLLHPFLGDRGRWLSEGLASYYQNVLRARSGELSEAEAWEKLRQGFARGRAATPEQADPLEQVSWERQRGSTMRVYWSGAAYWLERDLALRRQGDTLDRVLARFALGHLPAERRWNPEEFIAALENIAPGADWLASYRRHAEARHFPELPPADRREAANRAAIMRPSGAARRR